MSLYGIWKRRHGHESGQALPLALGFLILFAILIGVILNFASTSFHATNALVSKRDDETAVAGGINAAIGRIRPNTTLGVAGGTSCNTTVSIESRPVDVTCSANGGSGQPVPVTSAPPFAILTVAPYHGPAPTNGCVNVNDEVGIAQVQNSKLLTVNGNVYINSDVDSDVWSGGCPQTSTAQHIQVTGNAIVRESNHDLDVVQPVPPVAPPYASTAPLANPSAAQQALLADPGATGQPNAASWALPFTTAPATRTVPACDPNNQVVKFSPGTYNDAAALTTLMNGVSCPGHVFWFQPGAYYFNFTNGDVATNPAAHEWAINDGQARIIGGQANAVDTGNVVTGPQTWKPLAANGSNFSTPGNALNIDGTPSDALVGALPGNKTLLPTAASGVTFTNPNNALAIGGGAATATLSAPALNTNTLTATGAANGAGSTWTNLNSAVTFNDNNNASISVTSNTTKSLVLSGYGGANIPTGSTINSITASVRHNEGASTNRVNTPTISLGSCTNLSSGMTKRTTNGTDTVTVPSTCLTVAQANAGPAITYAVSKASGSATAETVALDGITLVINYTPPGSTSGSVSLTGFPGAGIPANATITAATLSVAHSEGTTDTNIVNAPSVAVAGCNAQSVTRRSSMTTDAVNLTGCSVAQLNAGTSLTYSVSHATGSATQANVALDGVSLSVTYSVTGSTSASVTLSSFAANPAAAIPIDATITSVRLRVAHSEDTAAGVNNPTVTITPSGASACGAVSITKRAVLGEDPTPSYDATSCLNTPTKINGGVSLVYSVSRVAGSGSNVHLDGVWLDVTYTTSPRPAWDPNSPTANPTVPGACRRDGDSFWTDGVQWVFGGDSRINVKSGQLELCDKPSPLNADPSQNKQEIVLFGVRGAAAQNTAPLTAASAANGSGSTWTTLNNAVAFGDNNSATISVTSGTTKSLVLSGYSGAGIPTGSTINSITASVRHNEGSNTGRVNTPTISVGSCTNISSGMGKYTGNTTDTVTIPTNCLTLAQINAGPAITYSVQSNSTNAETVALDGITLVVNYTSSAVGGPLNPESGCITKTPYYSPTDHSPAYNGACALLRVTRPTGTPPPGDVRKVTMWGTAYAPSAAFDLPVDLLPVPVFNRGVVARMLMLGYNVANNTPVPVVTTPLTGPASGANRAVTLTATISGKASKVVAEVEFCDSGCVAQGILPPQSGSPPAVVVHSWQVTR